MPKRKESPAVNYLRPLLTDGARPFLYRGGIRALLGLPDTDEGNMVFSPLVPPVGFRYAGYHGQQVYTGPQAPLSLSGVTGTVVDRERDESQYENFQQVRDTKHTTVKDQALDMQPVDNKEMEDGLQREGSKETYDSVQAARENEVPGTREKVTSLHRVKRQIDIPGFSAEPVSFPVLSHDTGNPPAPDKISPQQQAVSPAHGLGVDEAPAVRKTDHTRPVDQHSGGDKPTAAGLLKGKLKPVAAKKQAVRSRLNNGSKTQESAEKDNDDVVYAGNPTAAAQQVQAAVMKSKISGTPGQQGKNSTAAETRAPQQNVREAVRRIRYLSQAVYDMNRQSLEESAGHESAQDRQARRSVVEEEPAPSRKKPDKPALRLLPRIVHSRAPSGRRIPCAFWERSSLNRFHLLFPG